MVRFCQHHPTQQFDHPQALHAGPNSSGPTRILKQIIAASGTQSTAWSGCSKVLDSLQASTCKWQEQTAQCSRLAFKRSSCPNLLAVWTSNTSHLPCSKQFRPGAASLCGPASPAAPYSVTDTAESVPARDYRAEQLCDKATARFTTSCASNGVCTCIRIMRDGLYVSPAHW